MIALTGCGGDGDSGGENGETPTAEVDTPMPTEEPSDTPNETPTPADTETPMETATPATDGDTESSLTHDVGETFTVGEGENAVTYRIIEFTRANQVGSEMNNATANGTYLIVTLELTNPREETLEFPRFEFRLRTDDGDWQRFDREPSQKIESDDRIEVEHIGDDTFEPGASKIGAVVFDIDPEKTQRLWITPTGDAETPEHFVPVGDISEIEGLGGY